MKYSIRNSGHHHVHVQFFKQIIDQKELTLSAWFDHDCRKDLNLEATMMNWSVCVACLARQDWLRSWNISIIVRKLCSKYLLWRVRMSSVKSMRWSMFCVQVVNAWTVYCSCAEMFSKQRRRKLQSNVDWALLPSCAWYERGRTHYLRPKKIAEHDT